jgi:ribonuclease P protein subunit RPR2
VENQSKGGRKPWADILVMRCLTCGHAKRYPVSVPKQRRKSARTSTGNRREEGGGKKPVPKIC